MKYQHILNGKLLFETDSHSEFATYLMFDDRAKQAKHIVLCKLLEESEGHICNTIKNVDYQHQ